MTHQEFQEKLNQLNANQNTFDDLYHLIHQARLVPAVQKHLTALKEREATHVQSHPGHQPGPDLALVPQVRRH